MSTDSEGFAVGIEFESVLAAISKQIYETPLAFLRENVQNAVDALRMQGARCGLDPGDETLTVRITVEGSKCQIVDNGVGMTREDLKNLFWTIGASGKRTPEAREAGCVGMFGIGGFANFGVCTGLVVTSQIEGAATGYRTELTKYEIAAARGTNPIVRLTQSVEAQPRGTIVCGELKAPPNIVELESYIRDFVRYAAEHVYFNGDLVSRQSFQSETGKSQGRNLLPGNRSSSWVHGNVTVVGSLFATQGGLLSADVESLQVAGQSIKTQGWIRFENGRIDALKRGFKLCSTAIGSHIGVSGSLDCDRLAPTAGRDSLDAESQSLLASVVAAMERAAVMAILQSPDLIGNHTRIFKYVRRQGLVPHLGNVRVETADSSELLLSDVQRRSQGGIKVFFASSHNRTLSKALQAAGHVVVQLPSDGHKSAAVKEFLEGHCGAQKFEGQIVCTERYTALDRFERALLAELEEAVMTGYDIEQARIVPGRLTENIPVYARDDFGGDLTIFVDVKHPEATKLRNLGITPLFRSMVFAFCREYLASTLRSHSPKFFGSGAVNLDWLEKKRSELWVLASKDIEVQRRAAQRQVVRSSDVAVVQTGSSGPSCQGGEAQPGKSPKLLKVEGTDEFAGLTGYYLRIPNRAHRAYGDVIQQCDSRCGVWAGNKILLVASDEISSAFQVEIHLDQLITVSSSERDMHGGSSQEERPLQSMFDGLYFPVPSQLEPFLVPSGDDEIRVEVDCDWIDFSSARAWRAPEEEESEPAAL